MKALSLWQPWATLMAAGLKKVETRGWFTAYRGPLLIHAAKRKPKREELEDICEALEMFWDKTGIDCEILEDMTYGAILCHVGLIKCLATSSNVIPSIDEIEYWLGNYEDGRFMWTTDNLIKFDTPIPYRGSQGFFNVPDELLP